MHEGLAQSRFPTCQGLFAEKMSKNAGVVKQLLRVALQLAIGPEPFTRVSSDPSASDPSQSAHNHASCVHRTQLRHLQRSCGQARKKGPARRRSDRVDAVPLSILVDRFDYDRSAFFTHTSTEQRKEANSNFSGFQAMSGLGCGQSRIRLNDHRGPHQRHAHGDEPWVSFRPPEWQVPAGPLDLLASIVFISRLREDQATELDRDASTKTRAGC